MRLGGMKVRCGHPLRTWIRHPISTFLTFRKCIGYHGKMVTSIAMNEIDIFVDHHPSNKNHQNDYRKYFPHELEGTSQHNHVKIQPEAEKGK